MTETVGGLGEGRTLARIFPRLPNADAALLGPGDDAAVIAAPDGRFVVTANLERSTPRPGSPQMARYGSMTLLRLDPATGRLRRVGDYAFDGALPEMAVFDNASRFVAVTVFNQFDDPHAKGSIDFWRLEQDPFDPDRVELVKTRHSIPVTRGAHSMTIVR